MGLTILIDQNGDSQKYLDLKTALSNFFNNTTIDKLFNLTDDNAGFCKQPNLALQLKLWEVLNNHLILLVVIGL